MLHDSANHPSQLKQDLPPFLNYGWLGTIAEFLELTDHDWLTAISQTYQQLYRQRATATHRQAWLDCCQIVRSQFSSVVELQPDRRTWTLIFEYELPGGGGRRPDLIVLGAGHILVFEFKQKVTPTAADLNQVAAYARDLAEYHSASRQNLVQAILVPTRRATAGEHREPVQILAAHEIAAYLSRIEKRVPAIDANRWVNAAYAPLPTIIQAARCIFQHEPLPTIKRACSAGIPDLIAELNRLVEAAHNRKERHLVLITGVPGAGKTLVGLQFVYQNPVEKAGERQAVFLSGNRPLITVLQYALKSRAFVQEARTFYLDHEARRQKAPREHIIVFDEAQRAWDADRMQEKYGIGSAAAGAMLRIAERVPDWCVLVGLIGEGQQIHVGEEDGIEQWNIGLEPLTSDWYVHCPPEQADNFTAVSPDRVCATELFNLTMSLRSHLTNHVQTWVAHVLSGEFESAAKLMPMLMMEGFDAYLTRELEAAKAYCRDRYQDHPSKRYGLIASSRARNLTKYGINNDYMATQCVKIGAWYSDSPDSLLSCCAFTDVVTEFGCQGLELDFPVIGWGDDLLWQGPAWTTRVRPKKVRSPLRLRLNSYRVLLTRGRDGFVVFVPPEAKMNNTFAALASSGLQLLSTQLVNQT